MAFRNPPIAGLYLVRPALRSPNYVVGSQGWTVNRDGTVEFNNGTFRGSIESGSDPGQHFIVNNSINGHIVDAYDSSNRQVLQIDQFGSIIQYSYLGTAEQIEIGNGGIQFVEIANFAPPATPNIFFDPTGAYRLFFMSGSNQVSAYGAQLIAQAESGNNTKDNALYGVQRGNIVGGIVQTDSGNSGPGKNLMHIGTYNVTTDAGGTSIFNHGCAFTPTAGFLAGVNGIGANFPYQYAWFPAPFTSTTAKAAFKDNLGASLGSTTLGIFGVFHG